MEGGYVLIHVLEAVLPGHDLGDSPCCEISLGSSMVQCPIPTTLQSDNVALPTLGDAEPVVHVRAYDTQHRSIGYVVVPVSTLVPLEVWNVWYAMDEDLGDAEEKPPEETPKMHLLLQYVSCEAASQETAPLREMRSQDFLLRALQQLNASLEAKLVQTWSTTPSTSLSQMGMSHHLLPSISTLSSPSLQATAADDFASSQLGQSTGDSMQVSELPSGASPAGPAILAARCSGVCEPPAPASALAPVQPLAAPVTSLAPGGAYLGGHSGGQPYERMIAALEEKRARAQLQPPQASDAGDVQAARQRPVTGPPAAAPSPSRSCMSVTTPRATLAHTASEVEEALRARVEAHERTISALEERQRFSDDQDARIGMLAKSLQEQEQKNRTLHNQLQEANRKCQAEVEAEQELARQAHTAKGNLELQVAELQQEIALRIAHEDSLQKRAALMESELSVVHQKCALLDALEEEVQRLRRETEDQKEVKRQLQEQMQEQGRQLSVLQEEGWQLREERGRELEKARAVVHEETQAAEVLRRELQTCQDLVRDKEVENRLLGEKVAGMAQHITTLEGEVAACQSLLAREKQHRQVLEAKLEEQELRKLYALLEEHRQTHARLREELADTKKALDDEQGRSLALETHLAGVQQELVRGVRQVDDLRQQLAAQQDIKDELRVARDRNEGLQTQILAAQQDMRKMMEHHEMDIAEHSRAQQALCEEREERQHESCGLRLELARAHQRVEELRMMQEQTSRTLGMAREAAERSEDLQHQVEHLQEDVRSLHASREAKQREFEQVVVKFQDEAAARDRHAADLQKMLEDRNNEIKLLMYRVQELSSKYLPARGDPVDMVLAKWVNGYRPAVPFFRLAPGQYLFGRRQVTCKIVNDKPVFRVGGGFIGFDKFLELYASEELERLLSYELDERSGEPRFVEALKVRQAIEESSLLDEFRERAEPAQPARAGRSGLPNFHPDGRRSLNSLRLAA